MARAKRKKDARVARASRAMTLTPPINPGVMESRVLGHVKLMKDLLDRGLSFRSVPLNVIKTIVSDFQIAGLPVPPSALQLVHEHTQETPSRRPAPIWMDPLKMRSIRGDDQPELPYTPMDTRQDAIANNINPKTGYPGYGSVAATMPSVTGGGAKLFTTDSGIPYTPQYRYTKPLGVGQWLPPWMVSGDQPNQFVKTPPRPVRPMGVGVRPGYRAGDQITPATGGQGVLPGYIPNRVMLPQVPDPSQLPYTRRPVGEAAAIARYGGAGPAIAAAQGMANPPRAPRPPPREAPAAGRRAPRPPERGILPDYIPGREGMLPRPVPASQRPYDNRPVGEAAAIARYGGAGPAIAAAQGMANPPRAPEGERPSKRKAPAVPRRTDSLPESDVPYPGIPAARPPRTRLDLSSAGKQAEIEPVIVSSPSVQKGAEGDDIMSPRRRKIRQIATENYKDDLLYEAYRRKAETGDEEAKAWLKEVDKQMAKAKRKIAEVYTGKPKSAASTPRTTPRKATNTTPRKKPSTPRAATPRTPPRTETPEGSPIGALNAADLAFIESPKKQRAALLKDIKSQPVLRKSDRASKPRTTYSPSFDADKLLSKADLLRSSPKFAAVRQANSPDVDFDD